MKNLKLLFVLLISSFSYAQTIESLIQQNNLKLSEVENFIKQNNFQIPIDGCVDFPNPNYTAINSNYSRSAQRNTQNETQYVFNVYFIATTRLFMKFITFLWFGFYLLT